MPADREVLEAQLADLTAKKVAVQTAKDLELLRRQRLIDAKQAEIDALPPV